MNANFYQVLLIEDDQRLGKTLSLLMGKLPVYLTVAGNASQAIDCLNQNPFDLMILDLKDYEQSIFESMLQADHTPTCSDVLLLSDNVEQDDFQKTSHCKKINSLQKPFDPDDFLDLVMCTFEKQLS